MSHALKCPNPSCPFLFDPTRVPPGAVLTCPRCGMRFQLGPAAGPAGIAPPTLPTTPPGPAAPDAGPDAGRAASPSAVRRASPTRRPVQSHGGSPLLVTLAVVAVVGTACAVGFYLLGRGTPRGDGGPPTREVPDYNFAYEFPGPPWAKDPALPPAARANLFALRRDESGARAVFAAAKFDPRTPQPGDLREPLLDRLRGLFEDPDPTQEKGATWAGQPAVKYTFRGVEKGTTEVYAGEAYAIGYKGIGYWFLAWAPEREVAGLVDEFADLRGRFKLLGYRDEWKETAAPFAVFAGDAVDYRVIDTERIWKKPATGTEPRDVDPKADLLLWAEYPFKQKRDVKPRAELVTYVLDPAGDDPVAVVRAYIKARYAKEAADFGETRLVELTDEPQGDPPAHTEQQGIETVRLKAEAVRDSNRSKLLVLSGITVGGKVVGLEARCPWSDRPLWERRLIHVAASLRPGRP